MQIIAGQEISLCNDDKIARLSIKLFFSHGIVTRDSVSTFHSMHACSWLFFIRLASESRYQAKNVNLFLIWHNYMNKEEKEEGGRKDFSTSSASFPSLDSS